MKQISKEALQLAKYIHDWISVYAVSIQSNSPHTIRRYSITLSLFVDFLEKEKGIIPLNLTSECFSRKYIEDWIMWLKHSRNCSKETCNLRLSAIRSFLKFLAGKDVSYLSLYQTSTLIPMQKTEKRKITGMTKEAVKALMSVPDISTKVGLRDLTLLLVLYCTAARIDEVLSAKINQLHIEVSKPYITIIGKGRKIRTLYILPQAVAYLKKYLSIFHVSNPDPDSFIFYSRNNGTKTKMTSENVNQRLKKYAKRAYKICNDVPLDLHAHQIRHAKASHWLEDGMNIIQISFLLGHANLETTMAYLDITTEQESKALATLESENEQSIPKKWKMESNSLAMFLGIKNIDNNK